MTGLWEDTLDQPHQVCWPERPQGLQACSSEGPLSVSSWQAGTTWSFSSRTLAHQGTWHKMSSSLLRHPTLTRTMTPPCLQMRTPKVQQGLVFSPISRLGVQCSGIFFIIPSSHPPKPPSLLSSKQSQVGGKHFLSVVEHSRSSTENLVQQTCCECMEPLESPAGCTRLYTGGPSLRSSLLFPMHTQGEDGLITVLGAHRGGLRDPSPVLSKLGQGWVWNR
ncbi:uncharacterized protein LOC131405005 [Diceros bicornis minor]|uniref:uncharacterized protein LOC131405005 n=1 Tax=Diceros bicornis minor TaxID=77932 RepID=UPI0026EDE8F9|nr:uncharacterized protein LOC131405005 [Diceros bicornis minor]